LTFRTLSAVSFWFQPVWPLSYWMGALPPNHAELLSLGFGSSPLRGRTCQYSPRDDGGK
jgi:hypothetical protein